MKLESEYFEALFLGARISGGRVGPCVSEWQGAENSIPGPVLPAGSDLRCMATRWRCGTDAAPEALLVRLWSKAGKKLYRKCSDVSGHRSRPPPLCPHPHPRASIPGPFFDFYFV